MSNSRTLLITLLAATLLSACGAGGFKRTMPAFPYEPRPGEWDEGALSRQIDRFYSAPDMAQAAEAADEAREIAPEAAATHEILARVARFEGREHDAWAHFYKALAIPDNPAAYLHMLNMLELQNSTNEYREAKALFREIVAKHPDKGLRRIAAAFLASWHRRLDADPERAEQMLRKRGLIENFALISPFDNEDGKGFAMEFPPEREIDYEQEYEGTQFPARWRTAVPLNHQQNLDLRDLVSPGTNVTAYAASYVYVPQEGPYQLRVTTTDPIRMWVNDIEVLSQQKVDSETVDQFVVPVTMRQGWNRLLIKSCHSSGAWRLGVGLADAEGGLLPEAKSSVGPEEVAEGPLPGDGYDFMADAERRLSEIEEPSRKMLMAIELSEAFGLTTITEDLVDLYLTMAPNSLLARYNSALTAWWAGRLGGTIDTLERMIKENGDSAPRLLLFRATFFASQDRLDRARQDLLAALEANPDYRTARLRLARNYGSEGWREDSLAARQKNAEQWPGDTEVLWALADGFTALGRYPEAEDVYEEILDLWRGAEDILSQMVELSLKRNKYGSAIRYQETICEIYPNAPSCYLELGDILRRAGRTDDAREAYETALKIDDRWSTPMIRIGAMAYEAGGEEEAVELWKAALELDPDNHSLADRIEFVAPTDSGLLADYIPGPEDIERVIAESGKVELYPGANLIYLLDHAAEQVEADGSGRQVVTQIIMAVNDTGRDQLTQYSFPYGRLKVIEAYAIDPDGTRREASSLRGRQVRFRELKVGSVVVLQYRVHSHPTGYLARYLYRRWFFHGVGSQFEDSTFVLILPEEMKINEWGQGDWKRRAFERENRQIIEYQGEHVAPLVAEPAAPPVVNLLQQVIISSIPGWGTIAEWDKALMIDAFRSTPETKTLAQELTRDAETKRQKLDALTRFVMREIRYQQDYENTIAGVKPHAASIVLQRAYGDCKDKSVLLMTLAREVGIETRFAILRTTGVGDFIKDVPFLQFNHAIVYVPEQEGIPAPLFVDATPDTLDLVNLRPDDQGTWAMAIDPDSGEWEFIEIPFRPAEEHYTIRKTKIEPQLEGDSKITMEFVFQGPTAASLRQVLRNPNDTQIILSQLVAQLFPGARVDAITFDGEKDIVKPLTMGITVLTDQLVREQGDNIVIDVPKAENLSQYASLSERELPLQSGLYLSFVESSDEVLIPDGYKVRHMPAEIRIDNEFFVFERGSEVKDGSITVNLRFAEKQTRVMPDRYADFRDAVSEVTDNLKQDLIFEPTKGKKKGGKKGGKKKGGKKKAEK
jgi:tetratricopeptide (TPR) repeat protein/transglutaminase-like putative cysteine protease